MRTVITISLNGNAYQLDAAGYDALRAYLQVAEQRLAGNPDQMEILADLEQAIADKCGRYLGPHKNVVSAEEIAVVLQEMGPVDGGAEEAIAREGSGMKGMGDAYASAGATGHAGSASGGGAAGANTGRASGDAGFDGAAGGGAPAGVSDAAGAESGAAAGQAGPTGSAGAASSGTASASAAGAGSSTGSAGSSYAGPAGGESTSGEPPKRLYQIRDAAMLSGVCKGLSAYLNIDVSIVRVLFILLAILTGGVWILVYIVMMFVIPYAETSEQHAAAHGWPFNAEELVARAKEHYAQFRDSEKFRRQQWREQRRMWRFQRKQWREQRRDWERWGSAHGAPPPTPPSQQPGNASYTSQMLNGVLSPIAELLGAVLFVTFLILLFTLVTRHRIFGWWWPHDIPWWLGIVILVALYRVIAVPLRQARHAAYYGAPFAHGWIALWGALVWLALVGFLSWLAWQHWGDVQEFLQQLAASWRWLIEQRPTQIWGPEHAALYFLAWLPSCALHGCVRRRELQSHRQVDSADVLGEPTDRDVVHSGLGDVAYGVE
jgi:phage shock protein PspC (stress-responsive transcriptional regulator)